MIRLRDGRRLARGYYKFSGDTSTIDFVDRATGEVTCQLHDDSDYVRGATQLADGRLVTFSSDGSIRIWNTTTGIFSTTSCGRRSSAKGSWTSSD